MLSHDPSPDGLGFFFFLKKKTIAPVSLYLTIKCFSCCAVEGDPCNGFSLIDTTFFIY
jgi:hypothetical protein